MYNGNSPGVRKASFTHFTEKEGLFRIIMLVASWKTNLAIYGSVRWQGGVSKYDGKSFMHFTEKEGLLRNKVSSVLQDQSDNLWFCSAGGVSKYDGKSFTNFTKTEGLLGNNIMVVLKDESGNLWFGSSEGVSKYDGKSFIHFTVREGLGIILWEIYWKIDPVTFGSLPGVEELVSMMANRSPILRRKKAFPIIGFILLGKTDRAIYGSVPGVVA